MEMALKTSRNEVIYQILGSSTESTEIFIPSVECYKWTSGVAVLGAKLKATSAGLINRLVKKTRRK